MQGLKRIALSSSRSLPRTIPKVSAVRNVRCLSSLVEKERGEEAKYFRAEDEKKIADLKASVDKILAGSDSDAKEELVSLLSKLNHF